MRITRERGSRNRVAKISEPLVWRRFVSSLLTLAVGVLTTGVFVLMGAGDARAQGLSGSIRGTVRDSSGGVVPDVALKAMNIATGIAQETKSQPDGSYAFLQLAVGDYTVRAEKSGFQAFTANRIHLDVNTVYNQDIRLAVGSVTEQVEVEASAVQVETSSSQLGVVIDSNQIVNMPLIGRNFVNLQSLQPGVVGGSDRFASNYNFSTNGGQDLFNVFLIDGTDTNDILLNTTTFVPSPDAITEFRMVSGTINAEYARSSGAVLTALIKSGTNSFHGDAFEFYRDTFLNAYNAIYFPPALPTRQIFHQNLFGGTIGGPVIKNHTFFFASYQGNRASSPQPGNETVSTNVYTPAQLAGTFGPSVTSANVSPFPLWGDPCPPSGAKCAAGTPYSTLFASGNIPTQDFNSFSSGLANKFVPASPTGTFTWHPTRTLVDDQYIVRIDHTFNNSKDSIWGTWVGERFPVTEQFPFIGSTLPGFPESNKEHFKFLTTAWTHVLNDHMANELRAGYNRFNYDAVEPATPALPSSLGFPTIMPQDSAGAAFPVIDIAGLFHLGFSEDGPQPRIDQVYQAGDNFTWMKGRHHFKFGFEMRRWQVFNPFLSVNDGLFVFRSYGTYSTGNAGADFLLGIPTRYLQGSGAKEDGRSQEYYSYVQDEFKLRPNLTVFYGLGWTIDTPMLNVAYGAHGQVAWRPGQQSTVFPNAPVGVVYQGDSGVDAAGKTLWSQFGPRIGFAYSPDWGWLTGGAGKTSIRAGYALLYDKSETEQANQVVGMPPFAITSEVGVPSAGSPFLQINPGFPDPYTDIATGAQATNPFPFPGPSTSTPFTAANGNLPVFSFCCAVLDGGSRDPVAQNYNLTIERQLGNDTMVSVGYVGSLAHHLTVGLPQNLVTGIDSGGNTISQFDPSVYGPIDTLFSIGNSRYNSLQASVNRRLSRGLQFLVSYTYSHSFDNASGFENSTFGTFGGEFGGFSSIRASNPYCFPKCDQASSIFDARQRLVFSYFYQIPGIKRDMFISRLTRGWAVGGITTFQTGFPLDVIDSAALSGGCNGNGDFSCWDAPNQVAPVHYLNPRSSSNTAGNWFDPSAFAQVSCPSTGCPSGGVSPATAAAYGNAPRNPLRGPGINNWDFEIYKDTTITERTRIETRIEFYNGWNHTQFDPNGVITDINTSNFGQVTAARPPRRIQLAAKLYF